MTTIVSAQELAWARVRGHRNAPDRGDRDGTYVDVVTAGELADAYGFRVKPGLELRTYGYTFGIGGVGNTVAEPAGSDPRIDTALWEEGESLPDAPIMESLDGDGTIKSYVRASILRRDLEELGAWWHCCRWSTHELIGPGEPPMPALVEGAMALDDYSDVDQFAGWSWSRALPGDWSPRAQVDPDGRRVAVEFCTYTGFEQERVVCHHDTYEMGNYVPLAVKEWVVGTGPAGYIF